LRETTSIYLRASVIASHFALPRLTHCYVALAGIFGQDRVDTTEVVFVALHFK
jgi:hypothetical protein